MHTLFSMLFSRSMTSCLSDAVVLCWVSSCWCRPATCHNSMATANTTNSATTAIARPCLSIISSDASSFLNESSAQRRVEKSPLPILPFPFEESQVVCPDAGRSLGPENVAELVHPRVVKNSRSMKQSQLVADEICPQMWYYIRVPCTFSMEDT